jgi:hypothetical protein
VIVVEFVATRRYQTPFEPVRLALDWTRVHVDGVDLGPSEVTCKSCGRWLMPLAPCRNHDDVLKIMDVFPPRSTSGVDADYPADGVSLWACFNCHRGVAATW